jgi:phage terminase large subunit-like protein
VSPAQAFVTALVRAVGRDTAPRVLDAMLDKLSTCELAALAADWSFWARPKQLAPASSWRTWGFLTGRGFGKTKAVSEHINAEVQAGRAMLIGLGAQDEASSVAIQVLGPSGLIATAPPWMRPSWEASKLELVWPNGARAYVRTPEVPGKIRGLEYHLSWISELQSWPTATREEAYSNFRISTRLGYARVVWDATPKRRHPLLLELISEAEADPLRNVIVRGTTHENALNLGDGYVEDLERKYGGTSKGREELLGEMLTESESALVKQAWIDRARRHAPETVTRRIVAIDPAVTSRQGNDTTGIVDLGLGTDGQVYVFADRSGKHAPGVWADIVLDLYTRNGCDCVVVETNKGGDLVTQNLRAAASRRGFEVVVLARDARPRRTPGTVYVREIHARGAKEDRAQPLATAYERGLVSHVIGADLRELEDTVTTWEPAPGQRSPDRLDALVHGTTELLGLLSNAPDARVAFRGIEALAAEITSRRGAPPAISTLLTSGRGGGRRI